AGVGPGDEVVTTSLTFAATGNVIEHVGARPVFAEVESDTLDIGARTIRERLTSRTRAVVVVHYGGLPCDLEPVRRLCHERRLALIEDAAHAVGARYRDQPIGGHGNTACFSFYANKNMTTGEGGMLTTDDEAVAERVQELRLHGMSRDAWGRYAAAGSWRYDIGTAGFKCNMTDIAAALGLVQLERLDGFIERRAALAALYRRNLADLPGVRFQHLGQPGTRHAYHLFVIRLASAEGAPRRDAVLAALGAQRVGFSVHFLPLHRMSHHAERWGYRAGDLPLTERLGEELLSLPLYPDMVEADVERVAASVRSAFGKEPWARAESYFSVPARSGIVP